MNDKYWIAFSSIEEFGSAFVAKLYRHFGDIRLAWHASSHDLVKIEGLTKKQVENFVLKRKNVEPDEKLEYIQSKNIKYINFDDEIYPELLKNIYNPPMTLFYLGEPSRCNFERALAVVGSRRASNGAKTILSKIIDEFNSTDICIVSGGAAGIDTIAHESALKNNLSTIAVIGSGFDNIYPSSNKPLYKKIEEEAGMVVTEYWPTFEPLAWRFPQRNRIVSGISYGTLIAEAALKSGALITANLCLEQNRELMCIPGSLSNPNTQGIYKLLKQGASLVTNASDILETMNWNVELDKSDLKKQKIVLPANEEAVFSLISKDNLTLDEIMNKIKLNISDLMVILTTLELRGLIKNIEGEKYSSLV